MKTIWKYAIDIADKLQISMPKNAEILHFGIQNGTPQLWVLVDPELEYEDRCFRLIGTGHEIYEKNLKYIGSVIIFNDNLVFHLFELKN